MRRLLLLLPLFFSSALEAGDEGFVPLLGKDLSGWKVVPESAKGTFAVKDTEGIPVLFTSGKPLAYVHTEKKFKDFILRYEWKAPKEGQSGLLLHITAPHKIWPRCVQAQAQEDSHGRLFTMGGAAGKFTRDKSAQKTVVKVGEWNRTEVVSQGGKLSVKINDVEVSGGSSDLQEGFLGLQSEGTEFLFRNIRINEK